MAQTPPPGQYPPASGYPPPGQYAYPPPAQAPQKRSWRGTIWGVLGGALGVGLVAIIAQNRQEVAFSWLFWSFQAPLWLMLLITSLLAFVIGQFALMWRRHRRRKARRAARD